MKSGTTRSVRCEHIQIAKEGNELVSFTLTNADKSRGDDSFYIRLDQIEAISTEYL
jgi:hypothetical protein